MNDKGDHKNLSEDWLLDNLPDDWSYDCVFDSVQLGFIVGPKDTLYEEGKSLFIPLDLLKNDRTA